MSAQLHSHPSAQGLVALLQLGKRTREAASVEELGFIAVNETRSLLDYRQAALWIDGDVAAVSGVAQPDTTAPYIQWLTRLFKANGRDLTEPQAINAGDVQPLIGEEWAQWLPRDVALIPLIHRKTGTIGALLLARDGTLHRDEMELAAEIGRIYAHAFVALRPHHTSSNRLRDWFRSRERRWSIVLVVLAVLCIPVRLSVLVPSEATPLDPFVVRAPLDGVVDRFHVRPNQPVRENDALFDLDTTALKSRHAAALEAYEAAEAEYRQSAQLAVTDDKARVDVALRKGALDQRAVDLAYTESQLARVQVKASKDGVAVFADEHQWIGRSVAIGEKVLVLADPNQVELTAYMPSGDQVAVQPGSEIVFYPNAAAFTSYVAIVDTVAYHAEPTAENVLSYRIRAHFIKMDEAPPRLGLQGNARVHAGRVPLIYMILRRPLSFMRQWLGW